jgi:cation diffusion facilitator family transporter
MGTIEPPEHPNPADIAGQKSDISNRSATYIGPRDSNFEHAESSLWLAFLVNIAIGTLKFVAFTVSGSPSIFSESLHSFGDAVNSIALILGNKFSRRPPDRSHPFGYGLEANVWALAACVFLSLTSIWAISEGVQHLTSVQEAVVNPQAFWFSVVILLISVTLELVAVHKASCAVLEEVNLDSQARFPGALFSAHKQIRHVVSPTTRFVFYEDNIALLGALLALIAVSVSHFSVQLGLLDKSTSQYPDAIASILIGILLCGMAFYLFRHNRGVLTQTSASPNVEKRIIELVTSMEGVAHVVDLKTVDHGLAGLTVHLKVQVDPYTQVKDVDDITENIKEKMQRRIRSISQMFVEVLADESEIEWGAKFDELLKQGRAEGVLDAREEILLRNVYDLTERTVRDIMIPRTDLDLVELDTPLSHVAEQFIETGHSRMPVFRDNVDDLMGLVHAKDVFDYIRQGLEDQPLVDLVREIDIFPENKPVIDLLEDFRRNKIRMAAVADEHGGLAGLVTVEDVMEEVLGELWDEGEEEEVMITYLDPSRLLLNGKLNIEDLNEEMDLSLPFDDFKTVGGYVFGELGREPEEGDTVSFEDLRFIVKEADGARIVAVILESPVPFETLPESIMREQATVAGKPYIIGEPD